jgi:phenylpropionate dioxygenase-like ring-hydroxylating dioxygenase large terminal subunit
VTETEEVRRGLAEGLTLPAEWYCSTSQYEAEQRHIFSRSWHYAGHCEALVEPGSFLTCWIGPIPLIVLRDPEGKLRAFINICRHRGSLLLHEASGRAKSLQCGYHAWTYNLDGSLRAAPGSKDEITFDSDELGLRPAAVETWGPFVFVNPNADSPPLAATLGNLPTMVAETGVQLDDLKVRQETSYEIRANWKIVVENYLECYHCPVAHPQFSAMLDVREIDVQTHEFYSTQTLEPRSTPQPAPYETAGEVENGFYAFLWPNFTINIYPGPGNVSLNIIRPLDAQRTRMDYFFCFVDSVGNEEAEEFMRFVDQVQKEDTALCESVQLGLASGMFDRGHLMLERERAIQHFQQLVWQAASHQPPAARHAPLPPNH